MPGSLFCCRSTPARTMFVNPLQRKSSSRGSFRQEDSSGSRRDKVGDENLRGLHMMYRQANSVGLAPDGRRCPSHRCRVVLPFSSRHPSSVYVWLLRRGDCGFSAQRKSAPLAAVIDDFRDLGQSVWADRKSCERTCSFSSSCPPPPSPPPSPPHAPQRSG